jgi:hypothetical protein
MVVVFSNGCNIAAVFSIIVCYSNENTQFFKVVLACYDNAGASAKAILCSKMSS